MAGNFTHILPSVMFDVTLRMRKYLEQRLTKIGASLKFHGYHYRIYDKPYI